MTHAAYVPLMQHTYHKCDDSHSAQRRYNAAWSKQLSGKQIIEVNKWHKRWCHNEVVVMQESPIWGGFSFVLFPQHPYVEAGSWGPMGPWAPWAHGFRVRVLVQSPYSETNEKPTYSIYIYIYILYVCTWPLSKGHQTCSAKFTYQGLSRHAKRPLWECTSVAVCFG